MEIRLAEINSGLSQMIENIKNDPEAVFQPAPGKIYQILLAPLEQIVKMNEFDSENHKSEVVVIEPQENGLWLCCKLSLACDGCWCGPFDLYLDFEGHPDTLLEAWNTVVIHESDFKRLGYSLELIPNLDISDEWVKRASKLFHAYQSTGIVPDDLKSYVGTPTLDEMSDDQWDFQRQEMGIMELVRQKIHEGT